MGRRRKGKEEGKGKLFLSATVATLTPTRPGAHSPGLSCSVSSSPPQYKAGGPRKGTEQKTVSRHTTLLSKFWPKVYISFGLHYCFLTLTKPQFPYL